MKEWFKDNWYYIFFVAYILFAIVISIVDSYVHFPDWLTYLIIGVWFCIGLYVFFNP